MIKSIKEMWFDDGGLHVVTDDDIHTYYEGTYITGHTINTSDNSVVEIEKVPMEYLFEDAK